MAVMLAQDSSTIRHCEEQLRGAQRIALDTEFHAERRYLPRLYLVQIHIEGGDTWLVDPLHEHALPSLAEALLATTWVVHGGSQDLRLLLPVLGGLPRRVLDTQLGAALVRPRHPASYAWLQQELAGVELPKRATLSDWSHRPLSAEQIRYAAEDVDLLLPLWDRIQDRLRALDRLELAEAACQEALQQVLDPPADDLAWRDIHAVTFLKPRQAAVAQELAAWRIERARTQNQPIRSVLPDGLLAELSRTQPITVGELRTNRRISRSLVKKAGEELVERVARARRRPEWAWPQVIAANSPEARATRWLCLLVEALGHQRDFGSNLVLPVRLAEDVILLPAERRDELEQLLGWRHSLVGEEVRAALQGQISLGLCPGVIRERIFRHGE